MSTEYFLRVIRVEGIQWPNSFDRENPELYVQARLGGITQETGKIQDINGSWNDILILPKAGTPRDLSIKLFHKLRFRHNVCIGSRNIQLDELSAKWIDGSAPLKLTPGDKDVGSPTLFVHVLNPSNMLSDIESNVKAASQAILKLECATGALDTVEQGASVLSGREDLYRSLWNVMQKLSVVVDFMDELTKVNPYVKAAWQVTSSLSKAITHQRETDVRLTRLSREMQSAYDFVKDVQALPDKTQRLKQTIDELLLQTAKCCRFILNYTKRDFIGRMLQMTRPKIDEFTERFNKLKADLNSDIGLQNALISTQLDEKVDKISRTVDTISQNVDLIQLKNELEPYSNDAFPPRDPCLEGTREEVLIEITDWIRSNTEQNILWLRGVAGSGKSTIAATVVDLCLNESLLGAFLIFRRDTTDKKQRASILRTIAFKLAKFSPLIAKHVENAVKQKAHLDDASLEVQFKELLSKPLNALRDEVKGPVVIILEALDEYGSLKDRRDLMSILKLEQLFADLPSNIRFILTSRPEADIVAALSHRQGAVYELALDSGSDDNIRDVRHYIDHDMGLVLLDSGLDKPGDWETCMRQLAKASEGLFIWASTAIRLVKENPSPLEKLEDVVRNSHSLKGLNQLYNSVLKHSAAVLGDDPWSITRFSRIFSLVLQSKEPLTDDMIDGMLGFSPRNPSRLIFSKLQSVLVFKEGEPIRFLHKSFADFLSQMPCPSPCSTHQNPSDCLSGPWFIDTSTQKSFIAMQCFEIMKTLLHFNICKLESSFTLNKDVPDFERRVKCNIPQHLAYACMHWSEHLCDVPYSSELLQELNSFANNHLLYWLEVLCLLGESELLGLNGWGEQTDCKALTDSATWSETYNGEISSFLRDASQLASEFAQSITESTPHIYTSMIPLMKEKSNVATHYSQHSTSTVQIDRIRTKQSPICSFVLQGNYDIECAAILPNGKYIASVSRDGTIGVWSIESGRIIYGPFKGHDNEATCIAFSPDSRQIVSASSNGTIRLWDIETGALLSGPFEGHSGCVKSVAFSPSGTLIALGSSDETIKILDVKSGHTVHIFEGHTNGVTAVAFTSNGRRIVSGSYDGSIRVWKTVTGEAIGKPFTVHEKGKLSVAVSPNSKYIASGSYNGKVRVWDIESGKVVFEPSWRLWEITSVAFSPDSKWVVSGSKCGTIVVLDVESGNVVCGPLTGRTEEVLSVAFTPNGKRIISCSADYFSVVTVQIWDVLIREVDQDPFVCHTGGVCCAAYSPDGSHIATGSYYGTIVLWDTTTCKPVCALFDESKGAVSSIAFSPDGRRLVSGSFSGTIIIWDIENKCIDVGPLTEHTRRVTSVDFSPDGTRVVSDSEDDRIIIWDAGNGEIICNTGYDSESACSFWIGAVRFSPNGKLVASAAWGNGVTLWDAETGEIVAGPFDGYRDGAPLAFSPDGKCIASRSGRSSIIVRDVESGHIVCGPLEGSGDNLYSIAFSPDGRRIVSGHRWLDEWNDDHRGDVMIWDANDGTLIRQYCNAHPDSVTCIAAASNGSHVVSCSDNGHMRIWNMSGQEGYSATTTSDPNDAPALPSVAASQSSCGALLAEADGQDFADWSIDEDGWILGPKGERLLWIPPGYRHILWLPRTTGMINCDAVMKLDFKGAALGRRWQECFNPTIEAITYPENEAAIVDPDAGTMVASGQDKGIGGTRGFASLREWTEASNEDVHNEGSSKGTKRRRLQ